MNQELFDYLSKELNVTATQSEMGDIEQIVRKLPNHEIEIREKLQVAISNDVLLIETNEENRIKNEIERLKILNQQFKDMYVVLDNEGFPMFPTVSLDEETAIERMIKLGPGKQWKYYLNKGHKVIKASITISEQ